MNARQLLDACVYTAFAVMTMVVPARAQPGPVAIGPHNSPAPNRDADRERATAPVGHLPIRFEPTDQKGTFLARGIGSGVRLNGRSIDFPLGTGAKENGSIRVQFVGARKSSRVVGVDALPGRVNYLYGDDPARWRTNVRTYARARTSEIYRGIDVDYHGAGDLLEYDFIVEPHARPDAIRLRVSGESVAISDDGNLVYASEDRILLRRPEAYQNIGGVRRDVSVHYRRLKDGTFGFAVAPYDRHQALVIDPVVAYSFTFGNSAPTAIYDIAVDEQGALYAGGETYSAKFPIIRAAGSYVDAGVEPCDPSLAPNHCSDGFLAKLTPDGAALEYATYFGHPEVDNVSNIAVDANHALYFVSVWSPNGSAIGKLAPDGSRLVYLLPTSYCCIRDIAVGSDGSVYSLVSDSSDSQSVFVRSPSGDNDHSIFTVTEPFHLQEDTVLTTLAISGSSLFIGGVSSSSAFPTTPGAAQTVRQGFWQGVIMSLTIDGDLLYSTLVGRGTDDVSIEDLAVDSAGNVFVAGDTGVDICTGSGPHHAFIRKLSADGGSLSPATLFPYPFTACQWYDQRIALDDAGNAYTSVCGKRFDRDTTRCDFWKVSPAGIVLRSVSGVPSANFRIDATGKSRWFALPLRVVEGGDAQVVKLVPAITLKSLTASTLLPSRFALPITWTVDVDAEDDVEYSFWRYDGSSGSEVQAFGPRASYTWTPASWDVGDHALCAIARTVGTTSTVSKCVAFTVTGVATGEPAVLPPAADLNDDRRPDLIWVNAGTGDLAAWNMGGGVYGERMLNGGPLNSLPLPAGWQVVGTGDVDGDGHTDLFLQSDTGRLAAWFFDGWTLRGGVFLNPRQVSDTNWKVRAVGDFNHDGHPDLVWQYAPTGQVAFWLLNGTMAIDYVIPSVSAPGGDWEIVGTGDSNRDGERDLFWQQRVTGQLAVWRMRGTVFEAGLLLSSSPSDPKWHVAAVADLDGDAYSDVVFQHADTGQLGAWYLRDSMVRFGLLLVPSLPSPNTWKIAGPR